MRIVNRKELLAMPLGTVFTKIRMEDGAPIFDEYNPVQVLEDVWDDAGSLTSFSIGNNMEPMSHLNIETLDAYAELDNDHEKEIPFEHVEESETDRADTTYVIFSREEVEEMMFILAQAIQRGYNKRGTGE